MKEEMWTNWRIPFTSKRSNWICTRRCRKMTSFEDICKFRKKEKVTGTEVRWIERLGNHTNGFCGQIFCDGMGSVIWGVVMMEHPLVCSVLSHANGPFSEPFKEVYEKLDHECNGHVEHHTDWRLPALIPKVGTTSSSVCSCPKELFLSG